MLRSCMKIFRKNCFTNNSPTLRFRTMVIMGANKTCPFCRKRQMINNKQFIVLFVVINGKKNRKLWHLDYPKWQRIPHKNYLHGRLVPYWDYQKTMVTNSKPQGIPQKSGWQVPVEQLSQGSFGSHFKANFIKR